MSECNLAGFNFLNNLKSHLIQLDLSHNQKFGIEAFKFNDTFAKIKNLIISNVSLASFEYDFNFEHLDLSINKLWYFNKNYSYIVCLNLSNNNFGQFFSSFLFTEVKDFMNSYPNMKYIDLSNSLTRSISNNVFYFNKILETSSFSGNNLNSFPKFCQFCKSCESRINLECRLRELKFDANNLEIMFYSDLADLNNLEYLNLEKNSISSIEINSFSNLIKLETLSLSSNKLTTFNDDILIFKYISNLKFLF